MKKKKTENPLGEIEEQMKRIFFINANIELEDNGIDKTFKIENSSNLRAKSLKKYLMSLMKELKAKNIYLVV